MNTITVVPYKGNRFSGRVSVPNNVVEHLV